jgi:probable phosphoglycerate mutase
MNVPFRQIPFYFLRHGETDHNVNKIYDDFAEVHLNENGKRQAYEVQNTFRTTPIATVCSSPLLRVQQTQAIVLENKIVQNNVILDDLKECPGALWHLFLAAENRELKSNEWNLINQFLDRVRNGLMQALEYDGPTLLIAHGGTYWALSHLLQIKGDPKINNCVPMYITPGISGTWEAQPILME